MSNPSDKLPDGISGDDWFAKLKNAGHREFAKEFEMRELGRLAISHDYTTPAALLAAIETHKQFGGFVVAGFVCGPCNDFWLSTHQTCKKCGREKTVLWDKSPQAVASIKAGSK